MWVTKERPKEISSSHYTCVYIYIYTPSTTDLDADFKGSLIAVFATLQNKDFIYELISISNQQYIWKYKLFVVMNVWTMESFEILVI